jgi:hypothetical protein
VEELELGGDCQEECKGTVGYGKMHTLLPAQLPCVEMYHCPELPMRESERLRFGVRLRFRIQQGR